MSPDSHMNLEEYLWSPEQWFGNHYSRRCQYVRNIFFGNNMTCKKFLTRHNSLNMPDDMPIIDIAQDTTMLVINF